MKKILTVIIAVLMILSAATATFASSLPRVTDHAGLMTVEERQSLSELLDEISEKYSMDIVVLTENGIDKDTAAFADDFYDETGYDEDGVLFFLCMGTREWYISTSGEAMTRITNYDVDYIADSTLDLLGNGEYYEAFRAFALTCDEVLSEMHTAETYYEDYYSGYSDEPYVKPGFNWKSTLVISIIIGFIVGWIIAASQKAKLKSVYSKAQASDYVREGSFNLVSQKNLYLFANVSKIPIARNDDFRGSGHSGGGSSIHFSSSGASHGGHGGHF